MIRADDVFIDTDEGRFVLIVSTDDGLHRYDIHASALEFYAQVQRELRPYALEAEHARQAVARGVSRTEYLTGQTDEQADGYDPADPKHPQYVTTMVDMVAVKRLERIADDQGS